MSNSKYPWEEWFAVGDFAVIRKGEDYECNSHSMLAQIRKKAGKDNVKVSVSCINDYIVIERKTKKNKSQLPRKRPDIIKQIKEVYPKAKV